MSQTIMYAGGGTLGPVTPLLAIQTVLKSRRPNWQHVWVGTPDGPEIPLVRSQMEYTSIPVVKLRRYASAETLRDVWRMPSVLRQARSVVRRFRPSIVVGAGGFVSVPIGLTGKLNRSKLLIHQQDVAPGLANRLLAPWADVVTTVFPQPRLPLKKTVITGNPVRASFVHASSSRGRAFLGLSDHERIVVAMGGGTGAKGLNELISQAHQDFGDVTVVHLTGAHRGVMDVTEEKYIRRTFINEQLPDVLAAADLVITRAGMGSLSELSVLGRSAIILPMPDTHQEMNAAALEASRAAIVLDQRTLTPDAFAATVRHVLEHEEIRREMSAQMAAWNQRDAAGNIAGIIERLLLS